MPRREASINDWLMPTLLTTLIAILSWMAINIHEMSKSLAIAVTKIEDHDRRLSNLETLFLHPNN